MDPTKSDAEALLKGAGQVETAVRSGAPREHPLYVSMGLFVLLVAMAADLNDASGAPSVVAAVLVLVALVVTLGTHVSYLRRFRHVRSRRTPRSVEWALGLWSLATVVLLGVALDGTVDYSFTLGGVAGAAPFLLWAERLRRTA